MELKEDICSFCGAHILKSITERRPNKQTGQWTPYIFNYNGIEHRCLSGHRNEKDVYIKGSTQRGFPCFQKCGTFVAKDETLGPSQYREVVRKSMGTGQVYFDIEHGPHHTVERCIQMKQYRGIELTEEQKHVKWIVALDQENREKGKHFNPEIELFPADLFILSGFINNKTPQYVRNPKYHDEKGNYLKNG